PPGALGDAARPARLGAPHRAGRVPPRHALHRLRLQRLRADAGDRALGRDAHPTGSRPPVPRGVGRALLLGLSAVPRVGAHGGRGRLEAAHRGIPAPGIPGDADVRRQRREPAPADVRADRRCGDPEDRRRSLRPELGGLGNDRHQEGWLSYMNLGVASWRAWLGGRIADAIERYGVDAYFLDIAGGWIDNPQADMHDGMRRLVLDLRARYPQVMCCGEMHYDGLLEFIPFYHVGLGRAARYARTFSHLSHPAPGRGSSGVHESGFGRFNAETLSLGPGTIPTITVVDDTFSTQRALMEAVIERAKGAL